MGWQNLVRVFLQILAIVALIAAVILTGVALCTPAWRDKYSQQLHQHKQYGLWQNCAKGGHQTIEGAAHEFVCDYKNYSYDGSEQGDEWQTTVLILVAVGTVVGLLALIFSFVASCVRWAGYIWIFFTFIATLMNVGGVVYFAVRAYESGKRFELTGTETTEITLGWSYWCAVWGSGTYVAALFLGILTLLLLMVVDRQADRPNTSYSRITTQQATKAAKGPSSTLI